MIEVKYQNINGMKQKTTFEAFESTVFSHEFDHLNGILHIDIAEEVLIIDKEERKEFRKNHDYEIISKDCDFEDEKRRNK